eukprot:PLAT6273.1.p1 GENE.PLAT6273.1~~PLAT6273.1.p1  ORF type:complete len:723 (-),score=283.73 PLAT6273.1:59-2227(-)
MADGASVSLMCDICWFMYSSTLAPRVPRNLACGHVLCTSCCSKLASKGIIACPKRCTVDTTVPAEGVASLPRSLGVLEVVEVLAAEKKASDEDVACDNCTPDDGGDVPASTVFCADCSKFLCGSCAEALHSERGSGGHRMAAVSLRPLMASGKEDEEGKAADCTGARATAADGSLLPSADAALCEEHKADVVAFCADDDTLLCDACVDGRHGEHMPLPLEEAAERKRRALACASKATRQRMEQASAALATLEEAGDSMAEGMRQLEQQLDDAFDAIERAVRERRESLRAALRAAHDVVAEESAAAVAAARAVVEDGDVAGRLARDVRLMPQLQLLHMATAAQSRLQSVDDRAAALFSLAEGQSLPLPSLKLPSSSLLTAIEAAGSVTAPPSLTAATAAGGAIGGKAVVVALALSAGRSCAVDCWDEDTGDFSQLCAFTGAESDAALLIDAARCCVYAIGGKARGKALSSVEQFSLRGELQRKLPPLRTARSKAAATLSADGQRIIVSGGFDGLHRLDSVEELCLSEADAAAWQRLPSMNDKRSYHALLALPSGLLLALGGYNRRGKLASVEALPRGRHSWQPLADMTAKREAGLVALFDAESHTLWALGGDSSAPYGKTSVEKLVLRGSGHEEDGKGSDEGSCVIASDDKWQRVADLPGRGQSLAAVATAHGLTVFGATSGSSTNAVQRLDERQRRWTTLTFMRRKRAYAGAAYVSEAALRE